MRKLKGFFTGLFTALAHSVRRYPVALSLCAALTALALAQLHGDFSQPVSESLDAFMMTLGLAVLTALCLQAFSETFRPPTWALAGLYAGTAVLLALYRLYLAGGSVIAGIRLAALIAALTLVFVALPFLRRRDERPAELFSIRLAYRALVTGVYSGILVGGISAILLAMDKLLGVRLPDHIYEDVSLVIGGLFAPVFFLAGVPAHDDPLPAAGYPAFIRVLLLYVVIPLLGAYGLVLYIYFVKMLVTLSWPAGMLGNMVFWYILIGTAVLFLLWPLRPRSAWARHYCGWFPRLGVLPLLMMFISLAIRIGAYGITENRYFVWVVGMWLLAVLVVRLFRRQGANLWIPMTLAAVVFLTVMGPWSAFPVSRWSQNARLTALLEKNDMLVSGSVVPSEGVSAGDQRQIASILQYFDSQHSLSVVPALPGGFTLDDAPETLGFALPDSVYYSYRYLSREDAYDGLTEIAGYDYYYSGSFKEPSETGFPEWANYDDATGLFSVGSGDETLLETDIRQFARLLLDSHPNADTLPGDQMTFTEENDRVRVKLIFNSVGMENEDLMGPDFIALIDIK